MKFETITEEAKNEFWKLIEESENIFITSHISPDDDSISSTLGLYTCIKSKNPHKKVRIVYSNLPDLRYESFQNFEVIEFLDDVSNSLGETDLLIELDANQYSRATKYPEKFQIIEKKICIDHHKSEPDPFTLTIIDTTRPDCAEIVYEICEGVVLDKPLSEIFLLGILGDTGNFQYLKFTQTRTLEIAQKLIEVGQIEIQEFQSRYRYISERVFEVMREFMKNLVNGESEKFGKFTYTFLSKDFVVSKGFTDPEIIAGKNIFISTYIRNIKDHHWGFVVIPKPDGTCRISLRSLPQGPNVREISESMELGSGHDRASGGTVRDISDPKEAVDWFLSNLERKSKK